MDLFDPAVAAEIDAQHETRSEALARGRDVDQDRRQTVQYPRGYERLLHEVAGIRGRSRHPVAQTPEKALVLSKEIGGRAG